MTLPNVTDSAFAGTCAMQAGNANLINRSVKRHHFARDVAAIRKARRPLSGVKILEAPNQRKQAFLSLGQAVKTKIDSYLQPFYSPPQV